MKKKPSLIKVVEQRYTWHPEHLQSFLCQQALAKDNNLQNQLYTAAPATGFITL